MAVTMMIGPPGAGKSYEATVFQVLPALKEGRKVITNLPLNVEAFAEINEEFVDLIELVFPSKENQKPFSRAQDYQSDWKHPEDGIGPLFVVDECHVPLPRGKTLLEVEEWFAMHRHEGVDVILMTQSYGKVSKSICELVQTAIVLRKNSNLGFRNAYRRDVRDGLTRATSLGVTQRRYEKKYFKLYQSYTRGGKGEGKHSDIKPIWKRWPFLGLGAVVLYLLYQVLFGTGFNIFGTIEKQYGSGKAPSGAPSGAASGGPGGAIPAGGASAKSGPIKGGGAVGSYRDLAVIGSVQFGMAQVPVFRGVRGSSKVVVTQNQLSQQGYQATPLGPCHYRVAFREDVAEVGCE